jgi:hypothetical protein
MHRDSQGRLSNTDAPSVTTASGREEWYLNNQRHRDGGPAVTDTHVQEWYQFGMRDRLDGPAVIYTDGRVEYWVAGLQFTPENYLKMAKQIVDSESYVMLRLSI